MKKAGLLLAGVLLASSASLASTAENFVGRYTLTKSEERGSFCYQNLKISKEDSTLKLFRLDMPSMGPLYMAEINGPGREVRYSHGEAFSSTKGKDTVTLKNDTLTFAFKGRQSIAGIPALRVVDSLTMTLDSSKETLRVERSSFEGPTAGVGKKDSASCIYTRE